MFRGTKSEGLTALLRARQHRIIAGLPKKLGGNDEGPNPHEIIEAGLAACTILTCQMYADHKKWPLERTDVVVRITSETEEGAVFHREVTFHGELSDDQKKRLMEIVEKTPISNLLTRPIKVESELNASKQ